MEWNADGVGAWSPRGRWCASAMYADSSITNITIAAPEEHGTRRMVEFARAATHLDDVDAALGVPRNPLVFDGTTASADGPGLLAAMPTSALVPSGTLQFEPRRLITPRTVVLLRRDDQRILLGAFIKNTRYAGGR